MKSRTARIAIVVAALVVVGTLAFAAAEAAQAPQASQIPTVITSRPAAVSATATVPVEATAGPQTKPAGKSPKTPAATAPESHPSEPRQVVTPKVRDDGDDGGSNERDGAEHESDSGAGTRSLSSESSTPSRTEREASADPAAKSGKVSRNGSNRPGQSAAKEQPPSTSPSRN